MKKVLQKDEESKCSEWKSTQVVVSCICQAVYLQILFRHSNLQLSIPNALTSTSVYKGFPRKTPQSVKYQKIFHRINSLSLANHSTNQNPKKTSFHTNTFQICLPKNNFFKKYNTQKIVINFFFSAVSSYSLFINNVIIFIKTIN